MNIRVFISHKKEDKPQALWIQSYLRLKGIDSFLDATDKGPSGYQTITDWIVANLRKSTHILAVVSESTKGSMWVPFELGVGYERNEGIGTFLNGPVYNLPEYLQEFPIMRTSHDLDLFIQQCKKQPRYYIVDSAYGGSRLDPNYAHDFIAELRQNLGRA